MILHILALGAAAAVASKSVTDIVRSYVHRARALSFCCVCGDAEGLQRNYPAPPLSVCWHHYVEVENELRELLGLPGRLKYPGCGIISAHHV